MTLGELEGTLLVFSITTTSILAYGLKFDKQPRRSLAAYMVVMSVAILVLLGYIVQGIPTNPAAARQGMYVIFPGGVIWTAVNAWLVMKLADKLHGGNR